MSSYEPSESEVRITRWIGGTLAQPFYKDWINTLDLRGDERVLDFGSGSGVCSRLLLERLNQGGSLTCIDISQRWIAEARQALSRWQTVAFYQGRIQDVPLAPQSFDRVFIHFVLHDIPEGERLGIVRCLASKLTPDGRLWVREPVERDGIPAAEIRALMAAGGLVETTAQVKSHWYTGPVYSGVYCHRGK